MSRSANWSEARSQRLALNCKVAGADRAVAEADLERLRVDLAGVRPREKEVWVHLFDHRAQEVWTLVMGGHILNQASHIERKVHMVLQSYKRTELVLCGQRRSALLATGELCENSEDGLSCATLFFCAPTAHDVYAGQTFEGPCCFPPLAG